MFNLPFLEKHIWLVKIVIGIIFLFVFQLILSYSLKVIKKKAEKNKNIKNSQKDVSKILYQNCTLYV